MHTAALVISLLAAVGIIGLGVRFVLAPGAAMAGYGVSLDAPRALHALTDVKGIRDVTSGAVVLAVWAAAGTSALGWAIVAATLTPVADAIVVRTHGGTTAHALGVHGVTAVLMLAAGLVLGLS